MRQDDQDDTFFGKKRAVLFLGISVLPFFQLRARGLEEDNDPKAQEDNQKGEVAVQIYTPSNSFLSILNGVGIFGAGILGALYALAQKEKKDADTMIESMMEKLKEKEAAFVSLKNNFEATLLYEQEERMKQLKKAKEEQQLLANQLNLANSTINGLGQELKSEKRVVEELKAQVNCLETDLSKAAEDKNSLEQELKEKLNSIDVLEDKISLLSLELKDREDTVQSLSSSLAKRDLELKGVDSICNQTKDELANAHSEMKELKEELLKHTRELELKNSAVVELKSVVSSVSGERDESYKKLNAIQEDYKDLKSSAEKKAALDAKALQDKEDELHKLKEKLEFGLNEISRSQAMIVDLTKEREHLRGLLDAETSNVKNLKDELQISQEAVGQSKSEASGLAKQLKQSINRCNELESEVARVDAEFVEATERLQSILEKEKQRGEALASELSVVKEQLKKTKEELRKMSSELAVVMENHDNIQKELTDVYNKVEVTANELQEEKKVVSSLNREIQNLEKQILNDNEARESLKADLEEATKSLDEMNRNALTLSGDLERAHSVISSLEDQKQLLYKSLTDQKNASMEAQENLEDAHIIVMRLGKERENFENRAKKLEEELASAKGEILRLRSQMHSSTTPLNDQHPGKGKAGETEVAVDARKTSRRRRASSGDQ
uniref:Uncharacterized protein MANES_11G047800 n=1 Tax=Rhizophora mucronata TaxID=61149 RepID=A0A2P2JF17_RHIMU